MNILDMLKNAGRKTATGVKNFLSTTPTTINEQGESVPVEGAQPQLDVGGKIAPLVMAAFALKNPEMGAPMLNSYTITRQNQLDKQREDAWKQWEIKAKQKRQALEDERYNIEHPTYTVPTTADLAAGSPVDYGQYVQNPMTTEFKLDGGFKPQDQLQERINNLGRTNNQISFLNFGQETQPQRMPLLSMEAPEAQLRQPSRLDQFAGQTIPLDTALRLQGLDEQDQKKVEAGREKAAARQAKVDSFTYYRDMLSENDPNRAIINDAIKNPDNYNLDFAAKAYLESQSPKAQPMNYKGIGLPKSWETTFELNPSMATPENLMKALAAIKDPNDKLKAALELEKLGLTNQKLKADIAKIKKDTAGGGGTGSSPDLDRKYNEVIKAYNAYASNVVTRQKNVGGKPIPLKLEGWLKQPGHEGFLTTYNQATGSNLKTLPAPFSTNLNKKTTVKPQPKGIKIGGESITPVVANEIESAVKADNQKKIAEIVKKYGLNKTDLLNYIKKL